MSFPRYQRYKDSGVEWLGEMPEHWQVRSFRHSARIKNGNDFKHIEVEDGGYPVVGSGGPFARVSQFMYDRPSVLLGRKGTIDKPLYMDCPFWAVDTMYYTEIASDSIPKYVFYYSKCIPFDLFTYGSALPSMTQTTLHALDMPLPNLQDQAQIVLFLDDETAKINALIEEQRRLIELLKEKRQAVISHAVTKGLNPDVKMWNTGIKWIGEVPVPWTITRVKYAVSQTVDCLHTTPTYDGELLFPAIRTSDVEPGRLLLSQARLVSEEVYLERVQRLEPQTKDILYSREGERFGMAALVPSDTKVCLGQRMMMFRSNPSFDPGYLMWALNSSAVYQQVLEGVTGPTAPHVNIGEVINFVIPAPLLTEQQEISKHIDTMVTQMDELVARAQDAIELLEERRSALISAAVTGKIDVRNYTPKEAA